MMVSLPLPPTIVSLPEPASTIAGVEPVTLTLSLPSLVEIRIEVIPVEPHVTDVAVTVEHPAPGVTLSVSLTVYVPATATVLPTPVSASNTSRVPLSRAVEPEIGAANFWMRLLSVSATNTVPSDPVVTALPSAKLNCPSPEPAEPHLKTKVPVALNCWTRALSSSVTNTWPLGETVTSICPENWPSPLPGVPQPSRNVPPEVKRCTRFRLEDESKSVT